MAVYQIFSTWSALRKVMCSMGKEVASGDRKEGRLMPKYLLGKGRLDFWG
jgi:hypothetical protein